MSAILKTPFYAKACLIFIGLFAFISVLYIAQSIILPILYSILIAISLSPLVVYFVRKKMNRVLAIAISLAIVFLATVMLILLISSQASMFTDSFPLLLDKFYETLNNAVHWISSNFNVSTRKINTFISDTKIEIMESGKSSIGSAISILGHSLLVLILIPVYVFMILFYQPLLLDFIRRVFGIQNQKEVNEVLMKTKTIIQKYLKALLLEAAIIATLNSIGLLIIGIDYAIILGIMGAMLNVIPYIGGITAVALPAIIAFATKSPAYVLLVVALYIVIQFIDNHYISPKVVASKVKINALISIIVVLSGGALWGIPGMFLSIPLTAIVKVICDHIEPLKPWGFLLGDTMPTIAVFRLKSKANTK